MPADAFHQIGPYEVLGELGRGGMGVVYRARHSGTGAEVALKALSPGATAESLARFKREVRLAQEVVHPGIVRVLEAGEDGGIHWFAMELIEGQDLAALLKGGGVDWRRTVRIVRDVADALAAAHARGIVHRDVKPSNILIGFRQVGFRPDAEMGGAGFASPRPRPESDSGFASDASPRRDAPTAFRPPATRVATSAGPGAGAVAGAGSDAAAAGARAAAADGPDPAALADGEPRAHLTDFGLARSTATGSRLTRDGIALGTPAYMSPEQALGEMTTLTPAADVWGLGVVLFESLAGRRPFEGQTTPEVVGRVITAQPSPLNRFRPDLPWDLSRLCVAALAKNPGARPAHAGLFRDALDGILRGEAPVLAPPRGRVARLALAAVLAVGTLAGLVAWRAQARVSAQRETQAAALVQVEQAWAGRRTDPAGTAAALAAWLPALGAPDPWWVRLGQLRWAIGRGPAAREAWQHVPEGSPARAEARLLLGLEAAFRREGQELRVRDGIPDLVAVARSGDPDADVARAAVALGAGRHAEVRRLLQGRAGWPAALLRGLCESHMPGGDPAAAVRAFTEALDAGLPFGWALVGRGLAHANLGDHERAIADYDAVLRLAPDDPLACFNRGLSRLERRDLAGARADFDRYLALDPDRADGWLHRARVRRESGDVAGGIADLQEALRRAPENAVAWNQMGLTQADAGAHAEALAAYAHALDRDPAFDQARLNAAASRLATGDYPGAIADCDAILARNPEDAAALVNRGVARYRSGDAPGAIVDYTAALARDDRDPRTWFNRGVARVSQRDFDGARADFDGALARDPGMVEAYTKRAGLKVVSGDPGGALEDCREALARRPTWADALRVRGYAHEARGEWPEAVAAFTAALETAPNEPMRGEIRAARARVQARDPAAGR